MLKTRVMTAVIGAAALAVCISFGGVAFAGLVMILTILGLSEYGVIIRAMKMKLAILPMLLFLILVLGAISWENYAVAAALWLLSMFVFCAEYLRGGLKFGSFGISVFGYNYLLFGFGSLLLLRTDYFYDRIGVAFGEYSLGMYIIWFLFLGTWASDTFAYFGGSKYGKRRIVPSISPNKTLEGFIAGFLGTVVTGFVYGAVFGLPILFCAGLSALIGIVAPVGDLFESKLKRVAGIKDSGQLLPGHGGVLDRFDSLLFVAPTVLFYVFMFI